MDETPDSTLTQRPFVVPCAQLAMDAPLRWLQLAWHDLKRAPRLSMILGIVIMLVSVAVSALAWSLGRFALLAALLSGFVFVAPLIAVGLYCVSRDLAAGRTPALRQSFVLVRRVAGQAGVFALAQLVILLLWSRAGMMINAFFPFEANDAGTLIEFLAIGSAVGSVFAVLTFATAALSLPMIADREVDMVTACVSSIHAVLRNKPAMLLWAFLIAGLTVLGFLTAFLGLIIIMPWLAYATWHAYRETLQPDGWPVLE
ncbi:MAG: DUF2189 domain-containing protein [Betaproteobacteria bacterium]|nr:DUF2189 domain-containing protein [Betaproteobacteria bacterium]